MSEVTLSSVIYTAVKPMFEIYLLMGTGVILSKRKVLTVETSKNLSDVIITIIIPCLIFNKIITSITTSSIKTIGIIFFLATVIVSTGGLLSFLVGKATKSLKRWTGGLFAVGIFPNIADLPIVYVQALNSGVVFSQKEVDSGIAYICIFFAAFIFYQFNLGGYRLVEHDFRDQIMPNDEERDMSRDENLEISVSLESEKLSQKVLKRKHGNLEPELAHFTVERYFHCRLNVRSM
ncbi:hypothetical protein BABINDRAFT_167263 [Babjeviella inositovora NRRL Y-12698]|uniref:Uncharacterized protein n=1 Tax=Babjeviella inositovora NRRL Y-12698 TaxID=984486 RepID=A0A1E3QP34_9ASCO|nr:uncharacterized protein BABINDRAFT_167263 [Babjeviella inositovora NRRL Y-12698]ODQ79398.1 hypothetical protein BABINDRAFT_167263 [Babjeviella inositovora NRRL Y-12698]